MTDEQRQLFDEFCARLPEVPATPLTEAQREFIARLMATPEELDESDNEGDLE